MNCFGKRQVSKSCKCKAFGIYFTLVEASRQAVEVIWEKNKQENRERWQLEFKILEILSERIVFMWIKLPLLRNGGKARTALL